MPDVQDYGTEDEWMEACVPARTEEGDEQDQAVAVCLSIWRERDKSMIGKATKTVDGKEYPASDFLVVEDSGSPSTWHLQVKRNGEPDHNLMGAAWAALHGGYRGNRYEGPDKAAALEALKRLYASEDMETPDSKAFQFDMLLTKAERMADGRTRWQARANTGQWDLERERFDGSFWEDVLHNFNLVQEATTRSECCGMPYPILDIAHYSFRLPAEKRNLARAGYPIKLWRDGQALMAQGYFDDTPLGRAAAKAAAARPVAERRVSIGVWPDWGRVELDADGRRTYKGGRNRAYLDHLAMTAHPVDPGTELEVKSMTQAQDALDVLGEEGAELVEELEQAATAKSQPEGAVVKADELDADVAEVEETDVAETPIEDEPPAEHVTMAELQGLLQTLFESFRENLNERLVPMEQATEMATASLAEIKAQVDVLGATETEKVQAAIDSGGGWWEQLVKNSVQRKDVPVKGPAENDNPREPFNQMFGGLRKR